MIRIWAKVIKEEKILKSFIYEKPEKFDFELFFDYVSEICEKMDVCTPIILSKHIYHYVNFNTTIFSANDFPEPVDFDSFVLEEASNY